MRNKWKLQKWVIATLFLLVVIAAGIPTARAFMFTKSSTVNLTYVPAKLSCVVEEVFDGTTKSVIQVKNTSNTDVYIRVRLVTYWKDSKGNTVARKSPDRDFQLETDWLANDWFEYPIGSGFYYYTKPVAPDGYTTDMLSSDISLAQKDGESLNTTTKFTYHQALDILAEAIQSNPTATVEECWPVVVNDNKNLQAPTQTTP